MEREHKNAELAAIKYAEQAPKFNCSEGTSSLSLEIQFLPVFIDKHTDQINNRLKVVTPDKIKFWKKTQDEIRLKRPEIKSKAEFARQIETKCIGENAKYHNSERTIRRYI